MVKAAFLLLAVVALACLPRAAAADDNLVVGASFAGGIEVLENVAKFGGLYKAEHLEIDKQYTGSASLCAQLAAGGKIDVCATSIEPLILGYDKGLRLQVFFSRIATYEYVLAVSADGPIKTLAGFKGAVIGEASPGSPSELSANDMLAGAGLRRSDYTFAAVGAGAQALSALTSGKVAGFSDSATALMTEGAVSGIRFRFFTDPILDSIPNSAFYARPEVIATKGDLLRRYARAIVKAAVLIRVNPRAAARYALMGEGLGKPITPEALEIEMKQLIALQGHLIGADPASRRIGETPVGGVAVYCKLFSDNGLTNARVRASAIVTNQFISFANDFDRSAWIAAVKRMN
jgi:NitT/TauT family transport system substrate-binding protein